MFVIQSILSDRRLIFSDHDGEYFRASFEGDIKISLDVYMTTDEGGISRLFSELASLNKPWKGEKKWESLEKDFSISFSCSSLGQVRVNIEASVRYGSPDELMINVNLITEFGQLPSIAKDAKIFFERSTTI